MAKALPELPQADGVLTEHCQLHTAAASVARTRTTRAAAARLAAAAGGGGGVAADDGCDAGAGHLLGGQKLLRCQAVQMQAALVVT